MSVTIEAEQLDSADAQRLIASLDAHLNSLYPPEDNFLDLDAAHVDGSQGAFFVARLDGVGVGCAAIRLLSRSTGEVKRMFVEPATRGRGVGRALLVALEAWARDAGVERLVLETGPHQPEAIGLYLRTGFVEIPCFGQYEGAPNSVCYEKRLDAP